MRLILAAAFAASLAADLAAPALAQTATSMAGSASGAQAIISNQSTSRMPRQAPGAYAPGLTAAPDTCAVSAAMGVSTPFGGVSLGSAQIDEGCDIRAMTRMLHGMGQPRAALAMLCQSPRVREAMAVAGTPCPEERATQAGAPSTPAADPFFYDSRGRRYVARAFPSAEAAKRAGARRADTGEWVVLVP